ncbi:MAG: hypothetical protein V2I43_02650 [Parvularcula sp.]|nr:hypothetical protein [Parvularcula sp.]
MRRTAFAALALIAAAGCATTAAVPDDKAWAHVRDITDATYLGNDRLKVATAPSLFRGAESMEYALLARAAGEAKARGARSFAIVNADYSQRLGAITGSMSPLGRNWIGSYEELIEERERQAEGFGPITGASFIVLFTGDERQMLRETFDTEETYAALIDEWKRRRNIKPAKATRK